MAAQTYSDREVIVVDDGSIDDTAAVAGQFEGVRCLHQDNQGTAAARNHGIRESTGRHVLLLDADDRLLRDATSVCLSLIRFDLGSCARNSNLKVVKIAPRQLPEVSWSEICLHGALRVTSLECSLQYIVHTLLAEEAVLNPGPGARELPGKRR